MRAEAERSVDLERPRVQGDVVVTQVTPLVTGTDSGSWEMFRLDLTPGARTPHH